MNRTIKLLAIVTIAIASLQNLQAQATPSIKITGTVLDQDTNQPLEYATLVLRSIQNPDKLSGGITDASGKFDVETAPGQYDVSVEYISYTTYKLNNQSITSNTDLGTIKLGIDVEQLNAVEVVGERTSVELKLDKKVYNVGQDLTVKGGSVSDVLDNVPSVSVDVEGNVSLRGNESVRILINGKPSALSGLNPEALKQLPADAIERVEVITNPSARYDAEGTAGIINIVLKQGKTLGLNGSVNLFVGQPELFGGAVSLNLRSDKFNIFTTTTYRYGNGPGNATFNSQFFDANGNSAGYQDEIRKYQRIGGNINSNFGFEYFLDDKSSITNSFNYGQSNGDNTVDVNFFNYDGVRNPTLQRNRYTTENQDRENVQYSLNFQRNFNDDGHKLTFDYQYSTESDVEKSLIDEIVLNDNISSPTERTLSDESQISQLVQADYVLPFGKDHQAQLEMGYRGTFNQIGTDFNFGIQQPSGEFSTETNFSNVLQYTENVNAAYTQLGSKFGKFNILGGLRMEASHIGINLVNTNDLTNKNYVDWFPSLFLGYEFSETQQLTLSYSRRLRRPRSRFVNPFIERASNTNLFQGNPDLDPTYTNAFDFAFLKRWDKLTFSSSIYYNNSTKVFEFIHLETGDFVTIENPNDAANPVVVPVLVATPFNLATENKYGLEFTSTYSPIKNWRLTWDLNLFQQQVRGDFSYTNFLGQEIVQNFDSDTFTWFTRLSAKLPLPASIDFQTNIFYRGREQNAQGFDKGQINTSMALSKDIFKDKATLSLNVSDLFNTRKRQDETRTPNVLTQSAFQWRERQITLSLLYRFNQKKSQKERNERQNQEEDIPF